MKFQNKLFALGIILIAIVGIVAMPQVYKIVKENVSLSDNLQSTTNVSIPVITSKKPTLPKEIISPEVDPHNLNLVTIVDSTFNSSVDAEYPNLRTTNGFDSLLGKVVLVHNDSKIPIHAFVVKWVIEDANLIQSVIYTPYMKTPTPSHVLTGGVILGPNESRLLSPWFSLSKQQFAKMQDSKNGNKAISAFLQSAITDSNKDIKILGTSIDGVVFGDAYFAGSDESKLLDHFECERNGQHDEGVSIARDLKSNASDQAIIDKLNAHITRGLPLRGKNDRESLYYVARASQAQMLLQLFKNSNRTKLAQAVDKMLRFYPTVLNR